MPRKLVAEFELDVSLSQFYSYFWDDESPFYDAFMKEALKDTSISTQAKVEKVKRLKALTVAVERALVDGLARRDEWRRCSLRRGALLSSGQP